ncbi:uncharacterized protein LOC143827451 [Paroedura picta]|uniref:uncharacterized protein LOC143827451 n=1 Tax=Paroedura picta TaxID=143630 RepID=UPI004055E250
MRIAYGYRRISALRSPSQATRMLPVGPQQDTLRPSLGETSQGLTAARLRTTTLRIQKEGTTQHFVFGTSSGTAEDGQECHRPTDKERHSRTRQAAAAGPRPTMPPGSLWRVQATRSQRTETRRGRLYAPDGTSDVWLTQPGIESWNCHRAKHAKRLRTFKIPQLF